MTSRKTINIGLVGYGFMGRTHSNAFAKVNQFFDLGYTPVLACICGRDAGKVEAFADQWGYKAKETDWRRLIDRKDIDLIDIASPNDTHAEIAIAAAQAGKMVMCEKPLGRNAAEALKMVKAVEAAKVRNMVWYNYRRVPAVTLAKQLVEKALGKSAGVTLDNVRQSIEALPFGFLQKVDSQNLLTFIMDEHPQTIALILSHIQPQQAAEIIKGLPPERQLSVIRRVATMGQTSPEIIKEVERGLEHRMSSVVSQQFENAGGVSSVAGMLNVIDRATERSLLENLSREDPELVEEIRRLMFVFDDINSLGNKEIQMLLKNIDNSQWAMALKGANPELKEKILGWPERAASFFRDSRPLAPALGNSSVGIGMGRSSFQPAGQELHLFHPRGRRTGPEIRGDPR